MDYLIKQTSQIIKSSKNLTVLTGAGISVESNIPPFRGKGSLWDKIDPMEFAHINAFIKDPEKVWNGLLVEMKHIIDKAKPNDGHKGLCFLEEHGLLKTIITQNVDGLHQMAGNRDVIEFHGNFAWQRCMECGQTCNTSDIDLSAIPPSCKCGGIFRPNCIFFGELIPQDDLLRSREVASTCDVMLVIGTSAVVQPAASMPVIAKNSGATIIEINPEKTDLTNRISDYFLQGPAGKIMNLLKAAIQAET